jgi:hypothetical protein
MFLTPQSLLSIAEILLHKMPSLATGMGASNAIFIVLNISGSEILFVNYH